MPRFLIVRFSSIGDIVLTSPVIRCLKQEVPDAEIHYLTKPQFADLLNANPYLEKVWAYEKSGRSVLEELKKLNFDAIIDLHHNLRSWRVKRFLSVKSYSFRKLNIEKYLFVRFRIKLLPDIHIVDRYLETLRSFGVKNDLKGLDYFIPKDTETKIDPLPDLYQSGYVAIVVGALKLTKRLPEDMLKSLCIQSPFPVVLLGGKAEEEEGERISKADTSKIFNACGKFSINQSALMIRNAKVVITPDTGLMHIASAFGRPIISIWGNTTPLFGMYPYMPQRAEDSFISEVKNLSCRPCSKIGFSECPKKHFRCMRNQDMQEILNQLQILWEKNSLRN